MKTKTNKQPQTYSTMDNPATDTAVLHTSQDVKDATLIVSVMINAFVLSLWVVLQVTTHYDSSLASFFINR